MKKNIEWVIVRERITVNCTPEFRELNPMMNGVESFKYSLHSRFTGTEAKVDSYCTKVERGCPEFKKNFGDIFELDDDDKPLRYTNVYYEAWSEEYYQDHLKEHPDLHEVAEIDYDKLSKEELIELLKKRGNK